MKARTIEKAPVVNTPVIDTPVTPDPFVAAFKAKELEINNRPVITEPDVIIDVPEDHLPAELIEQCIALINDTPAPQAPTEASTPSTVKAPKVAVQYDLTAILAVMPDTFTPATLDKAFMFNDGGKTVRRHLRNHFAEAMTHTYKDKWGFSKTANVNIIEYFASRYTFNADALKTQAKA
jgi:predicted transcriptional regulator